MTRWEEMELAAQIRLRHFINQLAERHGRALEQRARHIKYRAAVRMLLAENSLLPLHVYASMEFYQCALRARLRGPGPMMWVAESGRVSISGFNGEGPYAMSMPPGFLPWSSK